MGETIAEVTILFLFVFILMIDVCMTLFTYTLCPFWEPDETSNWQSSCHLQIVRMCDQNKIPEKGAVSATESGCEYEECDQCGAHEYEGECTGMVGWDTVGGVR